MEQKFIMTYENERIIVHFPQKKIPEELIDKLIAVQTSRLDKDKITYYPEDNLRTYQQITQLLENYDFQYFMNGKYFTTLLEHARKIFVTIKLNK